MWLLIIGVIAAAIIITINVLNKKYYEFVKEHSVLLQKLNYINEDYKFRNIHIIHLKHSYDNKDYYKEISCEDYLIYQLKDRIQEIVKGMEDAAYNEKLYEVYLNDINLLKMNNEYDIKMPFKNLKKLRAIENKIYLEQIKKPILKYYIVVDLKLVKMNGDYVSSKNKIFYAEQIKELIKRILNKTKERYNDEEIWHSIERVERGKVSNKIRFKVFEKDKYRCVICGSSSNLEVDHIFPISKGGKSELSNLQTLCKKCNKEKSNIV